MRKAAVKKRKTSALKVVTQGEASRRSAKTYQLVLYVAGETPHSLAAIQNLNRLCETHLHGRYSTEIIDVSKDPERAIADQILALPTLVRRLPPPLKRIIGTLTNTEKVLLGLEIRAVVSHA